MNLRPGSTGTIEESCTLPKEVTPAKQAEEAANQEQQDDRKKSAEVAGCCLVQ